MSEVVDPAAAAAADPAAAAAAATEATAAASASAATALAKPVPLHERIPEKFHVKKGEEFDAEASMGKVLEGYKALEQRIGTGDAPPKGPEEYAINVPEELKESFKEDERTAAFRKDAHAAGLNQKQFDFVMDRFFKVAPELAGAAVQNSVEATIASLDKAWGAEYDKNLDAASKAFAAYADPADKARFDDIMRDPSLAYRILAKIGPELGEAGAPPRNTEGSSEESVQAMLTSEALSNPKHPEHKAARAKVDAYYAKKYGTAPVN